MLDSLWKGRSSATDDARGNCLETDSSGAWVWGWSGRGSHAWHLPDEKRGLLQPDSIILECTSGNTGISLAMLGAALGHRVAILMSESASDEQRQLIQQLGAELLQLFQSGASYQAGIFDRSEPLTIRSEGFSLVQGL